MQKLKFVFCLLVSMIAENAWTQFPDIYDIESTRGSDQEECYSVLWTMAGLEYINADCEAGVQPTIQVTIIPRRCDEFLPTWGSCSHAGSEILVNEKVVETVDDPVVGQATQHFVTVGQQDLEGVDELCITIRHYVKCVLTGRELRDQETRCIPVVRNGDTFVRQRLKDHVHTEPTDCLEEPRVCCNADGITTIEVVATVKAGSSQVNTVGVNLSGTMVGGIGEVAFPPYFNGNTQQSLSVNQSFTVRQTVNIEPEAGKCLGVAYVLNIQELLKETIYVGDCVEESVQVEVLDYVVTGMGLRICELTSCSGNRLYFATRQSQRLMNPCSGDLIVDVAGDDEIVSYEWEGPNGFKSFDKDLINVPYGVYKLTITDACCQSFTYYYNHCGGVTSESDWQPVDNVGIYCKTFYCNSPDCEVSNSTICEEAEGRVTYEDGQCVRRFFLRDEEIDEESYAVDVQLETDEISLTCTEYVFCYGERIDVGTGSLDVEVTYDDVSGLCTKILRCDGTEVESMINAPSYRGPWKYDEVTGCTREVRCDFTHYEIESGDLDLRDWEYDLFTRMCVADVYCDGIIVFATQQSEFPVFSEPWSWDNSRGQGDQCVKKVTCNNQAPVVVEASTMEVLVDTGAPCPEAPDVNRYEVFCNGIPTGDYTCGPGFNNVSSRNSDESADDKEMELLSVYMDKGLQSYFLVNHSRLHVAEVTLYTVGGTHLGRYDVQAQSQLGISRSAKMSGLVIAVCRIGNKFFTHKLIF